MEMRTYILFAEQRAQRIQVLRRRFVEFQLQGIVFAIAGDQVHMEVRDALTGCLMDVADDVHAGRAGLLHDAHRQHAGRLHQVRQRLIIAGQKAVVTKAKKSIANFKIREGLPIGCKVTLRGEKMYDFADRLINLALPRVRDFRGVSANSFDGRGNYALGIKEQLIFPEIEYDKVDKVRGMDVIFVTTANTDEEARELIRLFGMPYVK